VLFWAVRDIGDILGFWVLEMGCVMAIGRGGGILGIDVSVELVGVGDGVASTGR
jgi:hypothetical protein